MPRTIAAIFVASLLCGCSITEPVALFGTDGDNRDLYRIRSGEAVWSNDPLFGGSFEVRDGKLICSGSYDTTDYPTTITIPVLCNDGRKGVVTAGRQGTDGGFGELTLDDWTRSRFVFGTGAMPIFQRADGLLESKTCR